MLERTANLKPFFAALDRTARREAGAITRITHYGASEIGADGIMPSDNYMGAPTTTTSAHLLEMRRP